MADTRHLLPRTSPRQSLLDFAAPAILVKVGASTRGYHVNEKLICASSDFFDAAMKQEWRQGRKRVVHLPDADHESFNLYLNWLHTGRLPVQWTADRNPSTGDYYNELIQAYILGDALLDSDFKDAVVDVTASNMTTLYGGNLWIPNLEMREHLYNSTASTSKLRHLVVHQMARLCNAGELLNDDDNPTFLLDVAKAAMDKDKNKDDTPTAAARCAFHEHARGTCVRKRFH